MMDVKTAQRRAEKIAARQHSRKVVRRAEKEIKQEERNKRAEQLRVRREGITSPVKATQSIEIPEPILESAHVQKQGFFQKLFSKFRK